MLSSIKQAVDWLFGQTNEQQLNNLRSYVKKVNDLEHEISGYSDSKLRDRMSQFREQLASGKTDLEILPQVFAVVREAAKRQTGMRPYDVQILGAIALHQRRIAEMQTGEGKTLVATMPACLNALQGQVHVATVNDYLARRDREWMGPVYESLGLSVGVLQEDMDIEQRKLAYENDIVYGTAAQFGFDYLRDNMVMTEQERVQPDRHFAIVDEIDSILIDEARTPLIISGSAEESTRLYKKFARLSRRFQKGKDFDLDEKNQQITLTDPGANRVESLLDIEDIYAPENINLLHHLKLALRANAFFEKNQDYIVKDGRVVIVDEFTGRLMPDRRFSEGLHQALEAKEGMLVRKENQTLAQITLQNFFMLYDGLSGMTGTAKTEEEEFEEIYGLDVVVIPPNKPLRRDNRPDVIFKTKKAKFDALVEEIARLHDKGRPVLMGTNSIEKSERLSSKLQKKDLDHEVLNAKNHAREADIIKDAGERGSITIATNMAGRGTDIVLGEGVADIGGLHVFGAQRHESRRIDNQLRGRAGRQGDPGSSQFYLSLEDDLIRIFGGEKISSLMERVGMEEGQAIENQLLTSAIRRAQQKVEGINFERRKQVLKYDEVMAKQRQAIYSLRNNFIVDEEETPSWDGVDSYVDDLVQEYTGDILNRYCPDDLKPHQWDKEGLVDELKSFQNAELERECGEDDRDELRLDVTDFIYKNWENQKRRLQEIEEFSPHMIETLTLQIIDKMWREHLYVIDDLKAGIGWTSYGGKDPLVEFKRESFRLFQDMLSKVRSQVVSLLIKPRLKYEQARETRKRIKPEKLTYKHKSGGSAINNMDRDSEGRKITSVGGKSADSSDSNNPQQRVVEEQPGRNDPCPCGSGKKYKYCCGR